MKTSYKYIIWSCLMALLFCSCEDFLNETPESTYTAESFYTTQEEFVYAINAVYDAQQQVYDGQYGLFRFLSGRSDDTSVTGTNTYMDGADTFTDNASVQATENIWQYMYIIITRANAITIRIDDVEFQDEDLKSYIKGEAYALRGWAYHMLGMMFGGVPLIVDAEYTVSETLKIARSSQDETFDQAESDYKAAVDLLPDNWDSTDDLGRITKYAAEACLARLYMFRGDYSSALTALSDVITNGGYSLASTYQECFAEQYDNDKSRDRIWEVQYISGVEGEGQTFSERCMPEYYVGDLAINGSSSAMHVSESLINAYEDDDLRKDLTMVTNVTVGGLVSEYYWFCKFNYYITKPAQTDYWGVNLPIIRYADVLLMYAEADNEVNGTPSQTSIDYVNQIRNRAGLQDLDGTVTSTQSGFRDAIKLERRLELAFEGLRWFDLVRWGDAMEVMNEFFQDSDEGSGTYSCDGEYRYIFAIPLTEMTRYNDSSVMWQNPGYGSSI